MVRPLLRRTSPPVVRLAISPCRPAFTSDALRSSFAFPRRALRGFTCEPDPRGLEELRHAQGCAPAAPGNSAGPALDCRRPAPVRRRLTSGGVFHPDRRCADLPARGLSVPSAAAGLPATGSGAGDPGTAGGEQSARGSSAACPVAAAAGRPGPGAGGNRAACSQSGTHPDPGATGRCTPDGGAPRLGRDAPALAGAGRGELPGGPSGGRRLPVRLLAATRSAGHEPLHRGPGSHGGRGRSPRSRPRCPLARGRSLTAARRARNGLHTPALQNYATLLGDSVCARNQARCLP